jgi:hypothetical protein
MYQLTSDLSGWFLWMMISSIRLFRRQNPRTAARRILLPYAIIGLVANSAFAAALIFGQGLDLVDAHSRLAALEGRVCSPLNMTSTLLMTLLFFMNDALFVRTFRAPSLRLANAICSCTARV